MFRMADSLMSQSHKSEMKSQFRTVLTDVNNRKQYEENTRAKLSPE